MDKQEVGDRSSMSSLKKKLEYSYDNYGFWRWIIIFFVGLLIGVAVGFALAGILYGIRANEPDNKMTFQQAVEKTILSGIYFGITCSLLYVLAKKYEYNLELLILCSILLAGILASIGTSIPWQSLAGIGIVFISVLGKWIYLLIKKYFEEIAKKQQERINSSFQTRIDNQDIKGKIN
jgi:magnesium-transporting ATPase (P-type)